MEQLRKDEPARPLLEALKENDCLRPVEVYALNGYVIAGSWRSRLAPRQDYWAVKIAFGIMPWMPLVPSTT
jgi:hypothetical protein